MLNYSVVWLPDNAEVPANCKEVLALGGRIVDANLSRIDAQKVEQCLKINGEFLVGDYFTIKHTGTVTL